jgi:hypothetical protein
LADVALFIDGQPILRWPQRGELVELAPGSHVVRFERDGYTEDSRTLKIESAAVAPILCSLHRLANLPEILSASLSLRVAQAGAVATLDGEPLPRDWSKQAVVVPVGKHELLVSSLGFEPHKQQLSLQAGEARDVDVTLAARVELPKAKAHGRRAHHPKQPFNTGRAVAYGVGGLGVTAGVLALAIYLVADARYDQWKTEDAALLSTPRTASDAESRVDAHNTNLKVVWGLDKVAAGLAIGGVAALAGAVVLFLNTGRPEHLSNVRAGSLQLHFDL